MIGRRHLGAIVLFLLLASGCAAQGQQSEGRRVYDAQCAVCHGADLEGQPDWRTPNDDGTLKAPPHDETGHTWHHGDDSLADAVRLGAQRLPPEMRGISTMPGYDGILTENEIAAVLDYIKSTWPADIQKVQQEQTAAERAVP